MSLELNFNENNFISDIAFNSLFETKEISNNFSNSIVIGNTNFNKFIIPNLPILPLPKNIGKCCSCTKSKCNKLYCKCVAENKDCTNCTCEGCQNRGKKINITPKNSKFCNCKKSECLKQYCVCYKKGFGCCQLCKCVNCENKSTK